MGLGKKLLSLVFVLAGAVALGQTAGSGNSSTSGAVRQNENPFPGSTGTTSAATQNPAGQQPGSANKPASGNPGTASPANDGTDNPFPGEDPNAPIIPVGPNAGGPANAAAPAPDVPAPTVKDIDPDGDPVRTPDWNNVVSGNGMPANDAGSNDGFSSSRTGLVPLTGADSANGSNGKQDAPEKTPAQTLKEDLSVGSFYLDQRNWRAAESRFEEAFRLNPEEPKAVWGLAQSEQHLEMYAKAREHYELFLSYDPDGREGKEARKALKEMPGSVANGPHK